MKLWLYLMLPGAVLAHMVSMSTGEVKVEGNRAIYELRMPAYEAAHTPDPGRILLEHIHFRSAGVEGRLSAKQCGLQQDTLVCTATYEFPQPVDRLDVDCTYATVTVPNHVHLLRAYREGKSDQAVFDLSFTTAELRFHPPAAWEVFFRESGSGFLRALGGLAPLLFLIALALAARSGRELAVLAGSLVIGEAVACVLAPRFTLTLSPRFIEAAAALTVAYLAFEIVLLPRSGQRWLVVGVLGLFQGAYFSLFLTSTGYPVISFLSGVIAGEALTLAALYFALTKRLHRAVPAVASILLTISLVWFLMRVWAYSYPGEHVSSLGLLTRHPFAAAHRGASQRSPAAG